MLSSPPFPSPFYAVPFAGKSIIPAIIMIIPHVPFEISLPSLHYGLPWTHSVQGSWNPELILFINTFHKIRNTACSHRNPVPVDHFPTQILIAPVYNPKPRRSYPYQFPLSQNTVLPLCSPLLFADNTPIRKRWEPPKHPVLRYTNPFSTA